MTPTEFAKKLLQSAIILAEEAEKAPAPKQQKAPPAPAVEEPAAQPAEPPAEEAPAQPEPPAQEPAEEEKSAPKEEKPVDAAEPDRKEQDPSKRKQFVNYKEIKEFSNGGYGYFCSTCKFFKIKAGQDGDCTKESNNFPVKTYGNCNSWKAGDKQTWLPAKGNAAK